MQATVKMSRQGQITIPKEIRHLLGIDGEDYVTVDVVGKATKRISEGCNEATRAA